MKINRRTTHDLQRLVESGVSMEPGTEPAHVLHAVSELAARLRGHRPLSIGLGRSAPHQSIFTAGAANRAARALRLSGR